jgi:non-ribosomal peptide synthetase component F
MSSSAAARPEPRLFVSPSPLEAPDTGVFRPIPDLVADWAARQPNKIAVVCDEVRLTWAEFDRRVNRIANALIAMGFRPGDKAAVLAHPTIAYVETFIGILRAGGCVVPLSTMAGAEQLKAMIEDADSRAFFLGASMRELAAPFADSLRGLLPGGRIAFDFRAAGWQGYEDWLAKAKDTAGVKIAPSILQPDLLLRLPAWAFSTITPALVPDPPLRRHGLNTEAVARVNALYSTPPWSACCALARA